MTARRRSRKRTRKNMLVGIGKAGMMLIAISLGFLSIFLLSIYAGFFGKLPSKQELSSIEQAQASEIYSADGVLMGKYYLVDRSEIDWADIPQHLHDALIATEDARFYEHEGVDVKSLFRVVVKTLLFQQRGSGGGSTLSQQLAKNLYPRQHYEYFSLLINKIREWIIANRLEEVYSKQEIITLYLNTVPFGENMYGIESASQRFFNKPTSRLNTQEAAVLVGMLKANHSYNPRLFPQRSTQRRDFVLRQMEKNGYLSPETVASLTGIPLQIFYTRLDPNAGIAPYFREHIRQFLKQWIKEQEDQPDLYQDGLKIHTTIDSRIQENAEKALKTHFSKLQAGFQAHWKNQKPWDKSPEMLEGWIKKTPQYQNLKASGLSEEQIREELSKPVPTEVFDWGGGQVKDLSPVDSLKHYLMLLQVGFLALEPSSGEIKAWIGGIDHQYFKYDHVNRNTKRQVGSTFKPFIYASALEEGISPCRYIRANQTTLKEYEGWTPQNPDGEYEGKYSMEGALTHSVNTVTVKVLEKAGISNTVQLVNSLGVDSEIPKVPSIALGTPGISLIEMVQAYSVFVNGGWYKKPVMITRITDQDGNVLYQAPKAKKIKTRVSSETAILIRSMLQNVVDEGTARGLRTTFGLKNDLAGKTGTTQDNADGWFIGMTPKLVTGVWVGADDPRIHFRSTRLGQGAATALPVYGHFMKGLTGDQALRSGTQGKFSELPTHLKEALECDPFREDWSFWEFLAGKKKDKAGGEEPREDTQETDRLWDKFKGIFKKKK